MKDTDAALGKIRAYYSDFDESARLSNFWGQIEFLRTRYIISRNLQPPPAVVLDVGGASGRYACWLAQEGYEVHLIDPVPAHIDQAKKASAAQPKHPVAGLVLGDARELDFEDGTADAVLLMGPLYHLIQYSDRRSALTEALRVLKPGGLLFAAAISRFASTIDGLVEGYCRDPEFRKIMMKDLRDGQHRNPTENPLYFTDAYFTHPDDLKSEIEQAGFSHADTLAVEGISYMMRDLRRLWEDEFYREFLLDLVARLEREPSLLGASPHLLSIARKGAT